MTKQTVVVIALVVIGVIATVISIDRAYSDSSVVSTTTYDVSAFDDDAEVSQAWLEEQVVGACSDDLATRLAVAVLRHEGQARVQHLHPTRHAREGEEAGVALFVSLS